MFLEESEKKRSRWIIYEQIPIILWKKSQKNSPVDPEIIGLPEIVKSKKKKTQINASKICRPSGKFAERAKLRNTNICTLHSDTKVCKQKAMTITKFTLWKFSHLGQRKQTCHVVTDTQAAAQHTTVIQQRTALTTAHSICLTGLFQLSRSDM